MSVTVLLDVQSKPESIEELKKTFKTILPDTRNFDGCMSVSVGINQDDSLNLLLTETWQSKEQHVKYMQWRTQTGALDSLTSMLSRPPSIKYISEIEM